MKIIVSLLLCLILFSSPSAFATEEYAEQTARDCVACHLDPAGGGELTAAGAAYLEFLEGPQAAAADWSPIRLAAGFLHLFFALFWFGTILYVHLILKPAYASGGLPHGEVRLGLVSMLMMAITGGILMAYRVPSLEFLLTTRFGILLTVKIALFAVMVGSAAFVITFIGPKLRRGRSAAAASVQPDGDLTAEQLAACTGKEGRPACFAFRGKIYEVTDSKLWKEGNHFKRHDAGADLSEILSQAPHGAEVMERVRYVGNLIPGKPGLPLHQKVFYFMAYMNLVIVILITLIIALWRWG